MPTAPAARLAAACLFAAPLPAQTRPGAWQLLYTGEPLPGFVERYAVAPDGRFAATGGADQRIILWDLVALRSKAELAGAGGNGPLLAFSPDSTLLAVQVPHWVPGPGLRVFGTGDGKELLGWRQVPLGPGSERTGPAGARWREGAELWLHPGGGTVFHPSDYRQLVASSTRRLAAGPAARGQRWRVHPAGDRVAVFQVEGLQGGNVPAGRQRNSLVVRVFRVPEGDEVDQLAWQEVQDRDVDHPVEVCTFDFQELALGIDGVVHVLEFPSGKERHRFGQGVTAMIQDGARRVAGHRDGSVSCWEGQRQLWSVAALDEPVHWLATTGDEVQAGGRFGHVACLRAGKRWHLDETAVEARCAREWTVLRDRDRIQVFRDGKRFGGWQGRDQSDGSFYGINDSRNLPVVIARDRMVFRGNGELCVFDLAANRVLLQRSEHRSAVRTVEWGPPAADAGPEGWRLLAKDWQRSIELRGKGEPAGPLHQSVAVHFAGPHLVAFEALATPAPTEVAVAADGTCAFRDGSRVRVLRAADRRVLLELPPGGTAADSLALSADGRLLASEATPAEGSPRLSLWDVASRTRRWEVAVAGRSTEFVQFAPGNRWLVRKSGRQEGTVHDLASGRVVHEFGSGPAQMGETPDCCSFAWTPDGRELLTTSHACVNRGFDLVAARETLHRAIPDDAYSHFAQLLLAPDGRTLVTQHCEPGLVYLWDRSGAQDPVRIATRVAPHTTGFLPDGTILVATPEGLRRFAPDTLAAQGELREAGGDQVFVAPGGQWVAVAAGSILRVFRR